MSGYSSALFPVTRRTCVPCAGKKHLDCEAVFDRPCDCPCWDGQELSIEALAVTAEHWPMRAAIRMRLNGRIHMCEGRT